MGKDKWYEGKPMHGVTISKPFYLGKYEDELDKQKKQGRQLDRIKFGQSDSRKERSLQRPRVFYQRETEARPLVVARP